MKKLYFLMFLFVLPLIGISQGNETFDNFPSTTSSYVDGIFDGQDGSTWTFTQCRGDVQITGQSIMIGRNRTPQSEFYSGTITGGVGTLSFNYLQAFSTNVNLDVLVNDIVVGNVTSSGEAGVIKSSGTITVNQPGDVVIKFRNVNNSDGQVVIDDLVWSGFDGAATPLINISGSVASLDYFEGNGPSMEGDFSVSGINLNENITVSAPANFEVSATSGSGFAPSIVLTETTGEVTSTTVYVRLAAGLGVNTYNGDVTATSSGATTETISVSGTVSPADPQISVFGNIEPLSYQVGNGPSTEDTFFVEGLFLTENITVTAPTNFEVSLASGSGFGTSVSVAQTGGTAPNTTIYVRLAAGLAEGPYTGDISITSAGVPTETLALSGNVFGAPTNALVLTGTFDGPLTGGTPKGVEIYVIQDIPDLSLFGISGVFNGGGSSNGNIAFSFPAEAATAGSYIYVTANADNFNTFFGFAANYVSNTVNINGDDAIELYENGVIIDTFGDVNTDGTGQPWEYLDGWAYRNNGTGPDGSTFVLGNWSFSGINQLEGGTTNQTTTLPFPNGTYDRQLSNAEFNTSNFSLYPNPVSNGLVTINTTNSDAINVLVYDVLGKQVKNETIINNTLNVGDLNTGIYILKMTQNQATVTKKLIIK